MAEYSSSDHPFEGAAPDGIVRHETSIDLGGLMGVLSEHLYSTPDVAVRELVQNAHDSITRRRLLAEAGHVSAAKRPSFIAVTTNTEASTLSIIDNGSGLTLDEVHLLLATVGAGGTRELRETTGSDDLIGLFGLGFLSAFAISTEVVVTTTSATSPDETWQYRSFDGFTYSVLAAAAAPIGTTVTLHLSPGYDDLATEAMTGSVLRRYCRLLAVPISLNGGEPINLEAPWRHSTSTADDRLHFATEFDRRFEPLAALRVGRSDSALRGQLWVHGGSTYGNADNRQMSVYVRGMLLAENDQDLLPRWAGFVSGVVESPDLTPTASRESLQKNAAYTEAQIAIAEALIGGLSDLALHDPQRWRRILDRHSQALLGASVSDDRLFDLTKDQVVLPSSQGDRTIAALRTGNRLHVSIGTDRGFEELLFLARGVPIIRGDLYGVMPFLHMYCDRHGLELVIIGTDEGNAAVFEPAELDGPSLAWLQSELAGPDEAIHPTRFEPEEVPLVVVPDREAELKARVENDDLGASAGSSAAALARIHTSGIEDRPPVRVHVNLACPTVQHMLAVRQSNPSGAMRAIMLLSTLKTLMAASDRGRGSSANITEAFANTLVVIDSLLLDTSQEGDQS